MRSAAAIALLSVLGACGGDLDTEELIHDELRKLANPGAPPPDASNRFVGDEAAIALGHKFYFDDDFSGYGTEEDILLEQVPIQTRAARGERLRVACATCHDLDHGGVDPGEAPFGNRVSVAAGVYDVNSQPTINAAYNKLVYWNGRSDSLWTQILSVTENRVSMFGSRLRIVWRIADAYRDEYNAAFPDAPLPAELDSIEAQAARLEPDGSCTLVDSACPAPSCHEWQAEDGNTYCLPRFPLEGMPGFEVAGNIWHCNWGTSDPLQPYKDAFDCMELADRVAINRVWVNFAKAIAAYEYTLISVDTPFDAWVASDFQSDDLGASAQRGAALFVGKAACTACHSGPMMTDDELHNTGVPQQGDFVPTLADCPQDGWCDCVSDDTSRPRFCFPKGARDGLRLLQDWPFRRDSAYSDDTECANHRVLHIDAMYAEENPDECGGLVGHYVVPVAQDTVGAWRTPGLRNVALTGPYMHDGVFDTLEKVVEHYNKGAGDFLDQLIGELDEDIAELDLTDQEAADLVEFMKSLTGSTLPADITARPDIPPASPFPETSPFAVQ
jgi:cytochrome c peroxidase